MAPQPEGFVVPAEPNTNPFITNWSIGLRGTQTVSNQGSGLEVALTPQVSARYPGNAADVTFDGRAELKRGREGALGVTNAVVSASGASQIGRDTRGFGDGRIEFSRELANMPGSDPLVVQPAAIGRAILGGGIEQRFGRLNVTVSGRGTRTVYGESERRDTGITNNADQNFWAAETALRVGYQVTPITEVFTEANVGRNWFDQNSRTLGVKTDATHRSVKAGIAGNWSEVVEASVAVGMGQYLFDADVIANITSQLYEANLIVRPNETLSLTAALTTTIEPTGADSRGAVRVVRAGDLRANYRINNQLSLRASANAARAETPDTGETEDRRGIGIGADYQFGARTTLNADYNYAHRNNSATGTLDSHQVSVGVTVRR